MTYGLPQRAVLVALMGLNRDVPNSELSKRYGIQLKADARKRLVQDGLITVEKLPGNRGNALSLTDDGWAWVINEMAQDPPPRAGSGGGALYALLHGLKAVLDARSMVLPELFLGVEAAASAPPGDLEMRIRHAIAQLASPPGAWVELLDLRRVLEDISRTELDAALRTLAQSHRIRTTLHEDTSRITSDVAAAAIRLGGRDHHLVSIGG